MDNRAELLRLEKALKEIERRKKYNKLDFYSPYPKQKQFHALGATKTERLLSAGNQMGKTYCGGSEVAFHLTGRYPSWWKGRRWDRPVKCWVGGVTSEGTRDNPQRMLCGEIKDGWGTGLIPFDTVKWEKGDATMSRGISDFFDTILVDHVSGKKSQLQFKTYKEGREKWQGDTLDFIWYDEEPDEDIYIEGLARITATGGMVFVTFSPIKGWTKVVSKFLRPEEDDGGAKDRGYVSMNIDDAQHIPEAEKEKIKSRYPAHEREARVLGLPGMGSGKIFQTLEADFVIPPMPVPDHWCFLWAVDFGVVHPFAAVLLAFDRETDVVYVIHTIRIKEGMALHHAEAMKRYNGGADIPVAWPHDGASRREFDGSLVPLSQIYKKHGLNMLPKHATFPDGSISTEAGILQMAERLSTQRLKVFNTCPEWVDEYRTYHRRDDKIVKINDDLLSATRVGIMQLRSARPVMFGKKEKNIVATGLDFDLFTT